MRKRKPRWRLNNVVVSNDKFAHEPVIVSMACATTAARGVTPCAIGGLAGSIGVAYSRRMIFMITQKMLRLRRVALAFVLPVTLGGGGYRVQ